MITKSRFDEIFNEIETVTEKLYTELRLKFPERYVMFLADCEYEQKYEGTKIHPYIIDSADDRFKDTSRTKFLVDFLKTYYSFPLEQNEIDNDELRIQIELMIYTHIWESKAHLKMLNRLAHLLNGEEYNWGVNVPDMSKHEFIRIDTRDTFNKCLPSMSEIIKKGYHSSLRNAFAHSEYSLDTINNVNRINLYNYKGNENWELKMVTFDHWSERFIYSALLSYFVLGKKYEKRKSIITDLGTSTFQIPLPPSNDLVGILYNSSYDSFSFVSNI